MTNIFVSRNSSNIIQYSIIKVEKFCRQGNKSSGILNTSLRIKQQAQGL